MCPGDVTKKGKKSEGHRDQQSTTYISVRVALSDSDHLRGSGGIY